MIDVHCHLCYQGLDEIKDAVVQQSIAAGMKGIITCAYPKDLQKNYGLVKKYPGFLYLSAGLHPIDIKDMTQKEIDAYWDWIRSHADEIVAVGEIGLEKKEFSDEKLLKRFKEVFIQGLELAKEVKKPVVLHLRKAEQEGFDTVVAEGMKEVVFHYYSGNMTLAKQIIKKNYYISIPTTINNSSNLKDIGKKFPLDRLLTETDAPFSSPIPNQPNVPQNVRLTIEKIAELRKTDFAEVDMQTTANAERVFNLGKFVSSGSKSEEEVKRSADIFKKKLSYKFPIEELEHVITNVAGMGYLNEGIECGLLSSIFPDSKKAFGEGIRTKFGQGIFQFYSSGKMTVTGYRNVRDFNQGINDIVSYMNQNLDKALASKQQVCFVERVTPAIAAYYEIIKEAEGSGRMISETTRLRGRNILDEFFKRVSENKDNLGIGANGLAVGSLYVAGILEHDLMTQMEISGWAQITTSTLRRGKGILERHMSDYFEEH